MKLVKYISQLVKSAEKCLHIFEQKYQNVKKPIEICSICLENIDQNNIVTKCKHTFHINCLKNWLQKNDNCPFCRSENPVEQEKRINYSIRGLIEKTRQNLFRNREREHTAEFRNRERAYYQIINEIRSRERNRNIDNRNRRMMERNRKLKRERERRNKMILERERKRRLERKRKNRMIEKRKNKKRAFLKRK